MTILLDLNNFFPYNGNMNTQFQENKTYKSSHYYLLEENEFFTQIVNRNLPGRHTHEFIECFLTSSGTVMHHVDTAPPVQLKERCLVLLPTKVYHEITELPDKSSVHRDFLFSTKLFDEVFSDYFPLLYARVSKGEVLYVHDVDTTSIEVLNWYINNVNTAEKANRHAHIVGLLHAIGSIFSMREGKRDTENIDSSYPLLVQDILFHIKNKSIFTMSWQEIFNLKHYSKAYTCRTFKKYTGYTLTEYITKEKIDYAANLILNTNYSVNEIMQQLNFSSPAYFIKLFKQYYGVSPSHYRRHLPGGDKK